MARVLVVDDNEPFRISLRMTLEAAGHEVEEARDGVEALLACRRRPPDLLLCDLYMPNKDGLETIRELRRDFPGLLVVAMSGGSSVVHMNMLPVAQKLGAVQLLQKPVDPFTVPALVEQVLAGTAEGPPAP